MATLYAAKATSRFHMTDPELVSYVSPASGNNALDAVWNTVSGARLIAGGTGFTYDGLGRPIGGSVDNLIFDLEGDGEPDGTVTDPFYTAAAPVNMALLTTPAGSNIDDSADRFWAALLSGDDTITAPESGNGRIFGDFYRVEAKPLQAIDRTGGNDVINSFVPDYNPGIVLGGGGGGRGYGGPLISGDSMNVTGADGFPIAYFATLRGGGDTIALTGSGGYAVTGDANSVGLLGALYGGNDTIRSRMGEGTTEFYVGTGGLLIGDAFSIDGGFADGGNDRVLGSNYTFLSELLAGDVRSLNSGTLIGGDDTMWGQAGQDVIAGDAFAIGGGALTGGRDIIFGGEDSDILTGEFRNTNPPATVAVVAIIAGGNDTILGGNGNDVIAGEGLNGNFAQGTTLTGGHDALFGEAGDDIVYGDFGLATLATGTIVGGNDTIDGGLGNDKLDGQGGIDRVSFAAIAQSVVADLTTGTATGQGSDMLARFERITGSSLADTLRGDAVANVLDGGEGSDTLAGRAGNDQLLGRAGNDNLLGSLGSDVMTGGEGADRFFFYQETIGPATTDLITDFQNGQDKLNLDALNFASFAAVQALAVNTAQGLRIDLPGVEAVVVSGLTLATFDAGDVIL